MPRDTHRPEHVLLDVVSVLHLADLLEDEAGDVVIVVVIGLVRARLAFERLLEQLLHVLGRVAVVDFLETAFVLQQLADRHLFDGGVGPRAEGFDVRPERPVEREFLVTLFPQP